ncbi:MAG: tetratricopeptide repeat protein [Planctomycetes bacterium]|nr:tetratricopeptide repeat protein [Planctomycetota bacterium]
MKARHKKRLNGKALLILSLALLLLGGGIHFLHAFQVKRNAGGLLEQAAHEESQGNDRQAADYLRQYLGFDPADADVLAKYGLLLNKLAHNSFRARADAFRILEHALRRSPDRQDIRREVARLALQLGRFAEARVRLAELLTVAPNDVELLRLKAQCEVGAKDYQKAADTFDRAFQHAKRDHTLSVQYAFLLRDKLNKAEDADEVVEVMVAANQGALPAQLAAVRYYQHFGLWKQADRHVQEALRTATVQDPELFLLASDLARVLGNTAQARAYLERGQQQFPGDLRMSLATARLELRNGRSKKARQILQPFLNPWPEERALLWELAKLLIDAGADEQASTAIAQLGKPGKLPEVVYLEAQQLMRKNAWGKARQMLEQVRGNRLTPTWLVKPVWLALAECHEHMGNSDQRLLAYHSALADDAHMLPARRGMAASLAALGKWDKAIAEYRKLLTQAPELRLEFARVLFARTLRLPVGERNWTEMEQVLADLPKETQDLTEVRLLRANLLLARQRSAEARQVAEAERDREPKKVGPWLFLAGIAESDGKAAGIPALLDLAEKLAGRRIEWDLARTRDWAGKEKQDAQPHLIRMESRLSAYSESEGDLLRIALAEAHYLLRDYDTAARLAESVAARQPSHFNVRCLLCELAYKKKDRKRAERVLREIEELEGSGAWTAYGEAVLCLARARDGDTKACAEAHQRLATAAALRPSWSRVPLFEAEVYEQEKRTDKALEKYQAALAMGVKQLSVYRRMLQLLFEHQRYSEAHALIKDLPEAALTSPERGRLAAESFLFDRETGQDGMLGRQRALQIARKSVAKESTDHREYLWLGQMAWAAAQPDEAERALRKAVELRGDIADTWVTLILFLARHDVKKADNELARAERKLPERQKPMALAPCHEALDRVEQAEKLYEQALAAQPGDPLVLRNVASFYLRHGKQDRAGAVLQNIIDSKMPDALVRWARRSLALSLAYRGNYQKFKKAMALVEENLRNGAASEDLQAKALVLASQPGHGRQAIQLFETLSPRDAALGLDARFLLAQLYETYGSWDQVQGQMLAILRQQEKPAYVAYYVRGLLRQGKLDQAQSWLDKLVKQVRPGPRVFEAVELQARLLKARQRVDAATELLTSYVQEKGATLAPAGLLLEELGQPAEAEKVFRTLATSSKVSESVLPLARFLGRHRRVAEALDVCDKAWATCKPEAVAETCLVIIQSGQASEDHQPRAEMAIARAEAKHPSLPALPLILASLRDYQGRIDQAIAGYRKALALSKDSVMAGNNLAYLLALKGGAGSEPLELIQGVIRQVGPAAELLDTRALVYLKSDQLALALADLQAAIADKPNATKFLHLAQVHLQLGNRAAARQALLSIPDLNRAIERVHVLERPTLRKLAKELSI